MPDYTLIKGVDKLYYALVTQDDAAGYAAGTPKALAPLKLSKQTPKSESKTDYYDNRPMFTLSSEGETAVKVDIAVLPLDIQAEILGKIYDADTQSLYDYGGTPPDIALGFRAKNSDDTYTYIWYYKGKFAPFEEEANSETDKPDPKGVSLEFTAVNTVHEFDLSDDVTTNAKRRISRKQADGDTWFDAVQVPVVGSPSALTCTPSPVDGAAAQAVGVAIALTFNNPLAGNVENGVSLIRVDTAAPITITRSLNADRTVLTLSHSNLTAAKTYHIVLAGVSDIYGQALGDTVYDFATA